MTDTQPNRDQAAYWNELAGQRWVAMNRDLDAQLEALGAAAMNKLGLASGDRVLDVGCGAGATSLMLAERVQPGSVVGVDISSTMLDRARERGKGIANLRFETADAQTFAFTAASYDAIFSRFGVMFFADPVVAFRNLRSALRKGGKVGFVCWRALRENPSFSLPLQAAMPLLPEPPAPTDPGAPGPFAFAEEARLRNVLESAGYVDIDIAKQDLAIVFGGRADIEGAVDLALTIGPLGRAASGLDDATLARVRDAVRHAFTPYHGPSGVLLPSATWLVTARTP